VNDRHVFRHVIVTFLAEGGNALGLEHESVVSPVRLVTGFALSFGGGRVLVFPVQLEFMAKHAQFGTFALQFKRVLGGVRFFVAGSALVHANRSVSELLRFDSRVALRRDTAAFRNRRRRLLRILGE